MRKHRQEPTEQLGAGEESLFREKLAAAVLGGPGKAENLQAEEEERKDL